MDKKVIRKWEGIAWTFQARKILDGLKKFPNKSNIAVILRHSHRDNIKDAETSSKVRLTSEGKEFAKYFGKSLPKKRHINIYHSNVNRCRETALGIQSGLKEKSKERSVKGYLSILSDLNSDGLFIAEEMMKYGGKEFLIRWKEEYYPSKKIMNFNNYYQKAAKEIWNHLLTSKNYLLNLYITHDLHLTALKLGWFGIAPKRRWVSYLGGFAFSLSNEYILLLTEEELQRMEYPHCG